MSSRAPPTLLELAGRSLLTDSQRAILALEDLPLELFPPLFMEAFTRGHDEVLRQMVQAWPFTCLPLGALLKEPHLVMLRVALEGLDMLLARRDRPRRWRLQVLDLRNANQNFWRMWAGDVAEACSSEARNKNQILKLPTMVGKQPLKVFIDLCLTEGPLDEFQSNLYLWVKQRRHVLQLCCKKLTFFAKPNCHTRKILKMLDLNAVQKVEVHCSWKLSTLAGVAPFLGQMRNLRTLFLSHIRESASTSEEKKEQLIAQFTSQCLRMDCLQKFYANAVCFLHGHLDQVLRHLRSPLKSLSITNCRLSAADWRSLCRHPNTGRLQLLDLRGVQLTAFSPEPLRLLLEGAAATLKTLDLEACGLTDAQLQALLPALGGCAQLRTFSFFGNRISAPVLRELLRRTARLGLLGLELYPAPLESYDAHGAVHPGRFARLCAELTAIVRDVRASRLLVFGATPCPRCGQQLLYNLGPGRCSCPAPA